MSDISYAHYLYQCRENRQDDGTETWSPYVWAFMNCYLEIDGRVVMQFRNIVTGEWLDSRDYAFRNR